MERRSDRRPPPWTLPWQQVAEELEVDAAAGLAVAEAARRLELHGPNRLQERERRSGWRILADQLANVIVALLGVAAAVAFAFDEAIEGLAILAVLVINTALGFLTEHRAVRSMEALRRLARVDAAVRRDGAVRLVPAEELVPGDVVVVEGGDVISADLRLVEASKLEADESALTGESVPVGKDTAPVGAGAPLAERASMLFKGTAVTRGSGAGVVVATGMATELGRISALVEEAEPAETPLQRRLGALGRRLVWVTLGVAALVGVAGFAAGKPLLLIIETSLALAVAAVPEGLPIVATIAQARGLWRMARRNAVIERLSAVETLGSTGVILTDKTGTLTENRMTVVRLLLDGGAVEVEGTGLALDGGFRRDGREIDPGEDEVLRAALRVGVLCNNAAVGEREGGRREPEVVGDPMEVALVVAGEKAGLSRRRLREEMPELREVAFDPAVKMMATFHRKGDGVLVAVKGAPEAVLDASSKVASPGGARPLDEDDRRRFRESNEQMALDGLRVLALAAKRTADADADPYRELTFLGLVGLLDPPRKDVADALDACRRAGIRVVMVTGDQAPTAGHVATAVGLVAEGGAEVLNGSHLPPFSELDEAGRRRLLGASIIARATPEQKLDLIALHQETGAVVAMTGDGVNDAPALKKADIGIAMGRRGTQVAKEAAAMVLKDDAFATIVAAVEEGRVIFDNIRKFVLYLLSCNASEILVVGLASLVRAPLPILPLQILFLNLVTDVFPALALGVGEGSRGVLARPPRDPAEAVLARRHWWAVAGYGALITAAVLAALALALEVLGLDRRQAVTVSFLTLAFAQLWHVFDMRASGSRLARNEVTGNPWIWGALALCTGLLLAAVYVPPLAAVLDVEDPGAAGWGVVAALGLAPAVVGQAVKVARGRRGPAGS